MTCAEDSRMFTNNLETRGINHDCSRKAHYLYKKVDKIVDIITFQNSS